MKYIQLNKENYEDFVKLNLEIQKVHIEKFPHIFKEITYKKAIETFKDTIDHPKHKTFLAISNENVVGYFTYEIIVKLETKYKYEQTFLYVHQFGIGDTYKKKGYGSSLLEKIKAVATENNLKEIQITCWTDNDIANKFYNKQNFKTFHEKKKIQV